MKQDQYIILGINTGNSLDASDLVVTQFGNKIEDLHFKSITFTQELKDKLRKLRHEIEQHKGNVSTLLKGSKEAEETISHYTKTIAKHVETTLSEMKEL